MDIRLEDIEPPATPESSKVDESSSSEVSKVDSPKVSKPVLGKIQAKKRLMAFANKFQIMPKDNKLKTKNYKVKSKVYLKKLINNNIIYYI